MSASPAEVRAIVERVCARPEALDACARRDLGAVISALRTGGLTQGRIAELTGLSQGRLSEWATGKREPKAVTTFQKFADGVGLPPASRRALGLDAESRAVAVTATSADARVSYPSSPEQAVRNVAHLWVADLDDATLIQRGRADPRAWNDASLRWLVDPGQGTQDQPARGVHIGLADVKRFRATVDMFAKLDDKYGGGHARQALIQYLRSDADRMLSGRYTETVGRELFAAIGEATLLAAWMSYDSAPASALAQGYFVQALALAQAGNDRLLGASILDAMSHQATFVGRFTEARQPGAGCADGYVRDSYADAHRAFPRDGGSRVRPAWRREGMRACAIREHAGVRAGQAGVRSEWIRYFNESELSAEFGHYMRDLTLSYR